MCLDLNLDKGKDYESSRVGANDLEKIGIRNIVQNEGRRGCNKIKGWPNVLPRTEEEWRSKFFEARTPAHPSAPPIRLGNPAYLPWDGRPPWPFWIFILFASGIEFFAQRVDRRGRPDITRRFQLRLSILPYFKMADLQIRQGYFRVWTISRFEGGCEEG